MSHFKFSSRIFTLLLFVFFLPKSVTAQHTSKNDIKPIVEAYYKSFQERSNFERFLSFYDEDIVLEDIINGDSIVGKKAFSDFFDWNNPNFKLLESNSLIIKNQVIEGNRAVTQGYFTPFQWGERTFGPMHFTTILTFNQKGKIVKHVDWINYPSTLVDYTKRKDSNSWITKN